MSNLIDGIGVVSGILGIISFFQDNIPGDPPAEGASIRIKAGNPGDDNPGMEGGISASYGWDVNNNYLGESDGADLEIGDTADLVIDQFSGGSRADFVGVSVGNNAVCVAWVTVSQFDGTDGGAWTGDIGYQCDQHWYEQTEPAGKFKDTDNDYIPRCTWLDSDHTGDVPSASMKFRVDAYGADVQGTVDNSKQCSSTVWGPDDAPINAAPVKRGLRPREAWMRDVLIVSSIKRHRAENLCSSDTAWGPDFVGTDGYFCDMETHTLSPLCSTKNVDGCVNLDNDGNAVNKRSVGPKRAVEHSFKSYDKIKRWE